MLSPFGGEVERGNGYASAALPVGATIWPKLRTPLVTTKIRF
jgi:hypothetical protein